MPVTIRIQTQIVFASRFAADVPVSGDTYQYRPHQMGENLRIAQPRCAVSPVPHTQDDLMVVKLVTNSQEMMDNIAGKRMSNMANMFGMAWRESLQREAQLPDAI